MCVYIYIYIYTYIYGPSADRASAKLRAASFPWELPDLGIPPLENEDLHESDPLKSRFSVCGLAAACRRGSGLQID